MNVKSLRKFLYLNTYGWIAIAGMLICALSGIFLAIPFDISNPYLSIARILLNNPAAAFFRNVHFWSAQIFFIFTILHIYDHLKRSSEDKISGRGLWLRLTLSIAFVGYVMISGFILKADPDSQQARRILSSLIQSLPLGGKITDFTFIGPPENLQILYMHHIATATIIILMGIYDHVRSIWVNLRTLIITAIVVGILAFLFRAPLGTLTDTNMKGPWYFVGIQELLHWISHPWVVIVAIILLLLLIFLLPEFKGRYRKLIKQLLFSLSILYLLLSITGIFFRGESWNWQLPWETNSIVKTAFRYNPVNFRLKPGHPIKVIGGQPEGCLDCHTGMKGLGISHSENSTGCFSCHLGDPFTLDKDLAHRKMAMVPGNLSNASRTCGSASCHPQIVDRVNTSIMTTLSGLIQIDRYVFHETDQLDGKASIHQLSESPADLHLRNLCSGCHLGSEKLRTGPVAWLERGGGCNACHLTYRKPALDDWYKQRRKNKQDPGLPLMHPSIDLTIGNSKCKSCHSRSGRISMNYEGWHETTLKDLPITNPGKYQQLPDKRIFQFVQEDVHFSKGLSCIDCHSSFDLMGDGKNHSHKEEAVHIACADCHPKNVSMIKGISLAEADRETQMIAWLRKYSGFNTPMIITRKSGTPLVNTFFDEKGIYLKSKISARIHKSPLQTEFCGNNSAHQRLSCNTCHTSWAPQCIGCHNSYDKQAQGFDMFKNKTMKGSWIEYAGTNLADAPILGVNEKDNEIQTYVPGMVLTIDKSSFTPAEKDIFHRLYAPASAHTTIRKSRSCQSCHNSPEAIGAGRGTLTFTMDGQWIFEPRFENNINDGLPEDAWTGFLKERKGISATRNGHRSFNIMEQKRILLVGSCLTCHPSESEIMKSSLKNFQTLLDRRSSKCTPPSW